MRKLTCCLLMIAILTATLSSCASHDQQAETPPTTAGIVATTETESIPETAIETSDATTVSESTADVTEETVPAETEYQFPAQRVVGKSREPVMALPEVSGDPTDFFSDAAFIGDSISYSLYVYQNKTGELGNPLFLVRGKLGLQNTLNNVLKVYYQGKEMTPWAALAASGAKKVFIMLGTNDIGYYGIDETMGRWDTFVGNIRELCPDIQIFIQSLTPMWTESEQKLLNNANIDIYNQRLEAFADENSCHFVNIAPYFKDSTNGMAVTYSGDRYVHMCEEGVAAWVTVLKAYAAEQEKEMA